MIGKNLLLGGAALPFALALAAPAFQHSPGQHTQPPHGAGQISDVGAMFKKNCSSCHIPPDLRFKPDKAWLGQIRETA